MSRHTVIHSGLVAALSVFVAFAPLSSAEAGSNRDKRFFDTVAGYWKGPGEIVAGKYKGTKFTCNLTGESSPNGATGMKLDGTCRVGMFSQPMSAVIAWDNNRYQGKFLDGAKGKGLDIVSGVVAGDKVVVNINRAKLDGAIVARMEKDTAMHITISVKVAEQMVPVIGLKLNRQVDALAVGSVGK